MVLALGLLLVAASFSFLQSLLYQQPEDVVIPVVAGTKLAAAVLFGAVLQWMSDTGYATLAKLIITLAAGAFLVFLAQGSYSALPSTLMATGYSLLELTSLLLIADLASYARWNPVRLICAYYFIDSLGYVLGCLLLGQTLVLGPTETRLAAAALSLLLLVCAVWVFNEKRVNDLTWLQHLMLTALRRMMLRLPCWAFTGTRQFPMRQARLDIWFMQKGEGRVLASPLRPMTLGLLTLVKSLVPGRTGAPLPPAPTAVPPPSRSQARSTS